MKIRGAIDLASPGLEVVDRRLGFDSSVEARLAHDVVLVALRDLAAWDALGQTDYPSQFFGGQTDPDLYRTLADQVLVRELTMSGRGLFGSADPRGVDPFLTKVDSDQVGACVEWGAATDMLTHNYGSNVARGAAMLLKASIAHADLALDLLTPQDVEELVHNEQPQLPPGISEYKFEREAGRLLVVGSGFYNPESDGPQARIDGYAPHA